ncbi:MAG: AraC family transcriptional regulator [Chloroflexia bacterium]|nr:AraC family transcriptional regulator [Chloroflexia bacterium]
MLHITPKHLTKCVKQSTNQTPTDFIFQMLMLEAKVLLKETNLTISEIAFSLSFDDDAYFNRFFKNIAGITPNNYRKSVKL